MTSRTRSLALWITLLTTGCSYSVDRFDEENSRILAEKFLNGELELSCESIGCAGAKGANENNLKEFYNQGDWKNLARLVIRIGYRQDIMYYYLGRAAEGLARTKAARAYYYRAIELSMDDGILACAKALFNVCNGLDIPQLARNGLRRSPATT